MAKSEFASCGTQTKHTLIWQSENVWFLGLSWWASMATIAHIVYGTSTFSSATFIGQNDAVAVFARYATSVAVCRIVVAYELSGLRATIRVVEKTESASE